MEIPEYPLVVAWAWVDGDITIFVVPADTVEVRHRNLVLEALLRRCDGETRADAIVASLGLEFSADLVRRLLLTLSEHRIVVDSRHAYRMFHPLTTHPVIFPARAADRKINDLVMDPARKQYMAGEALSVSSAAGRLGALLLRRASRRNLSAPVHPLSRELLTGLTWCTNGAVNPSRPSDLRPPRLTIPSAGALRPVEQYVAVVGPVEGVNTGIYYFSPEAGVLTMIRSGNYRERLQRAMYFLGHVVAKAYVVQVLVARLERSAAKYGNRGYRYAILEAGHAAQNAYLYCAEQDLAVVECGGFVDEDIANLMELDPERETPLTTLIIGRAQE